MKTSQQSHRFYSVCILSFLAVTFLLFPFLSLTLSLFFIFKFKFREDLLKKIFFFISLYLGFLAFTQKTNVGDISRVYAGVEAIASTKISFLVYIFSTKYILWNIINDIIYKITDNVQFISLFWVTLLYQTYFLGILNLLKYKKQPLSKRNVFFIAISSVFCFAIFTQTTELMKQAIATSLFFYGFTCFLLDQKIKSLLVIVMSFGIHFTPFFFLPLLLCKKVNNKLLIIVTLLSFVLRGVNVMELTYKVLSKLNIFSTVTDLAEKFSGPLNSFFQSGSTFFVATFFFFFFYAFFVRFICKPKDYTLVNAVLIFVIVLNICYTDNHSFTRMLTLLYPFYSILFVELLASLKKSPLVKMFAIYVILSVTLILNLKMASSRISKGAVYPTSFMNNSLQDIAFSTSMDYICFKAY